MASDVRVRFAPSPTGKLHIGGARTAIYNWAFARANGGTFILRIDDTDPTRSTDENTQIILRAMRWLGLDWDEGPEVGGDFGPYAQTERLDLYKQAAQKLWDEGKAYPCFCTKEQLDADRKAAQERKDPFQGYQRRCRDLDPEEARRRIEAGESYVLRIKVPEDRGDVVIHDAVHGEVTFDAKELDDFVIFRSDGTPTYNFATVVDDAMMKITHVIRGDDHLSNTPRQVMDLLQEEIERMRREGVDPEVFMLVKNQMYGELLGDVEAVDDAAEEAAAACLKGRTLADEIAALAALTVEDANALLQTALREENRAYVQIDPAEK